MLSKPIEKLESSQREKARSLNSNMVRQADNLIQAMAIAKKRNESEIELKNLFSSTDISLTFSNV